MTQQFSEKDILRKGFSSLAAELEAVEGQVLKVDADGQATIGGGTESGGSLPSLGTEYQVGSPAAVPNTGAFHALPWALDVPTGAELLDLSDASDPTVKTPGVYAVTVYLTPGVAGSAGRFQVCLALDADNFGWQVFGSGDLITPDPVTYMPTIPLALTAYVPPGGSMQVSAKQDSDDDVDFYFQAAVALLLPGVAT